MKIGHWPSGFTTPEASSSAKSLKTKIIPITKKERGSFKGHFLIGLSIIEKYAVDDNT